MTLVDLQARSGGVSRAVRRKFDCGPAHVVREVAEQRRAFPQQDAAPAASSLFMVSSSLVASCSTPSRCRTRHDPLNTTPSGSVPAFRCGKRPLSRRGQAPRRPGGGGRSSRQCSQEELPNTCTLRRNSGEPSAAKRPSAARRPRIIRSGLVGSLRLCLRPESTARPFDRQSLSAEGSSVGSRWRPFVASESARREGIAPAPAQASLRQNTHPLPSAAPKVLLAG